MRSKSMRRKSMNRYSASILLFSIVVFYQNDALSASNFERFTNKGKRIREKIEEKNNVVFSNRHRRQCEPAAICIQARGEDRRCTTKFFKARTRTCYESKIEEAKGKTKPPVTPPVRKKKPGRTIPTPTPVQAPPPSPHPPPKTTPTTLTTPTTPPNSSEDSSQDKEKKLQLNS